MVKGLVKEDVNHMDKKIVIIGGVAGGASTAARLRRHSEADEIIMFEKGPHVSFSNCALPYHLSGAVEPANKLVLMSPEKFLKQYNIIARVNEEVVEIDRANKKVKVYQHLSGEIYEESYDQLILSPGAKPIVPALEGLESIPTFTVRNVADIIKLKTHIEQKYVKKITVIGGGYIGIEVAENLREAGYDITLIEGEQQVLRPFDDEMVQIFHKVLMDHGIKLSLGSLVSSFEPGSVVLASGERIETEMVVMAIGVKPESKLAKDAGLEIGETGAIAVDDNYQTSDESIYAIGDAIEVNHLLTGEKTRLTLAGPAQKAARAVADHINGMEVATNAYMGSSAIKVFEYNGASTGLNENSIKAQKLDLNYDSVHFILNDKVGIMPGSHPLHFKLLFEVPTGKILGAQAIGKGSVDKRIDVIATAMKFKATVHDLKDLELCYAPPFGTAKDIVNYAGFIASNLLAGDFKQITVDQVRPLLEQGHTFIDVREVGEYERGHLGNVKNIPLSELRQRVDEIPKDKPVYIHCRTGQRSYNAVLALQNLGYKNVVNVTGGFLGLSFYEYFKDQVEQRRPIMTDYNFN